MVKVEKTEYHGWPNCQKISNDQVELIVTTDVGPRIIYFGFLNGENQMYENPADRGVMSGDTWRSFGGHRLWHAPEHEVRTYSPDNHPVQVEVLEDGARFICTTEKSTGIQKMIEIHLSETEAKVSVNHTLINHNLWAVPLAVWALTVMNQSGRAIIPHSPRVGHDEQLLPNGMFALWGYTKMDDPRWSWGEKYFFLNQDPSAKTAQKIGSMNVNGWAAYQRKDVLFIKRFGYNPQATYPDFGCNFETYTDANILEVETLGPLVQMLPGSKAEHLEEWTLHQGIPEIKNDVDADQYVLPLV